MMREFTSAPAEAPVPFTFKVDKETFTGAMRQDADSVLEWSDIAHGAALGEAGFDSAEGAAIIGRYFQLFLDPAEYRRFRRHLTGRDPVILGDIMAGINEDMEALVGKAASRPTMPPSRSSAGRGAKGERTLQIISLKEGDVEFVDPPTPASRQQRRQQRPRGKRRAG